MAKSKAMDIFITDESGKKIKLTNMELGYAHVAPNRYDIEAFTLPSVSFSVVYNNDKQARSLAYLLELGYIPSPPPDIPTTGTINPRWLFAFLLAAMLLMTYAIMRMI